MAGGGHAGSLSGAMGVLGGCVPLSSIPIPSVTAHRREVIPQACPTSPAPLPTQGHPRQGRASAHPSLQAGRSPPTFTMAPGRGRGDEMQPHPPAVPPHPAQPLLPENAWKNSGVRGQGPPQGRAFIPRAQNGEGAGPRFVSGDERRGASPAPSPARGGSGAARGPPGSPGRISAGLEAPGTSTPPTRSHGRGGGTASRAILGLLTAPPSQPPIHPSSARRNSLLFREQPPSNATSLGRAPGRGHLPPLPLLETPRAAEWDPRAAVGGAQAATDHSPSRCAAPALGVPEPPQ